jgi:hypothetical protein
MKKQEALTTLLSSSRWCQQLRGPEGRTLTLPGLLCGCWRMILRLSWRFRRCYSLDELDTELCLRCPSFILTLDTWQVVLGS